jgi:hypothetical protein
VGVDEAGGDDCPAALNAVLKMKTVGRIKRLCALKQKKELKLLDSQKRKSERKCSL